MVTNIKNIKKENNMYVVLVYDIKSDLKESSRITNNVFKICKKFLVHVQNSVFEGNLNKAQFLDLNFQLKKYLREGTDSCIMFKSNNDKWLTKEFVVYEENKNTNML